ncbi:hypothetical protein GOARA_026_00620 [Gordonia araii NBRC 100433]|uniref:Uncharacterized protein n=1 Tax=Gordonia araii NBRC 100433 TaxID=1073574 RepID=G7GZK7_9ACTN|nr:ESX secretion-associated protein EspG [Gordonia araii NBRC 100433]GAB09032.1 hypothetical protein GOARA_026_00620 [Gordonia araii NBRC 100433]
MFEVRIVVPGVEIERVDCSDAEQVARAIPLTKPIGCQSIRVREVDLLPRLENASEPVDVLAALRAAGATGNDAAALAWALGAATSSAEIVVVDEEGRTLAGAVAVFCSPRGDVVSIPSVAADGGKWLTLAPATARRVARACANHV